MQKLFILSFFGIILLAGCASMEMRMSGRYHSITAAQAYKMISGLENYIILDVRTEGERQKMRIPGSISIPLKQVKEQAENELTDKNAMIFVHCRSGGRSTVAAKELFELGYTNIYDFKKITRWPGEILRLQIE